MKSSMNQKIFLSFLILFFSMCSGFTPKEELVRIDELYAIYELNEGDAKPTAYLKDTNLYKIFAAISSQRGPFLENGIGEPTLRNIVHEINLTLKKGKSSLIIIRREDKLAPFTRLYRTSLIVGIKNKELRFLFGDVDSYKIYGDQFSTKDWSRPDVSFGVCKDIKYPSFSGEIAEQVKYLIDPKCQGNVNYKDVLIELKSIESVESEI